MELIQKILEALNSVEAQAAIIAIVLEFALRLFKSQKPLSILHAAAAILKSVGNVLSKAGEVLDKVLPQRVLPPASEQLAQAVEKK